MIKGILRQVQGWVKLKGATDGTMIGNVSDALKVAPTNDQYTPSYVNFPDYQRDAFNRIRVSNVNTIFDYSFTSIVDFDVYWSQKLENGATATHDTNNASRQLSVTTTVGSRAIMQTRRHMEYRTGKSHRAYFTGNLNGIQQGMRKRLGLFTANTGYFFEITDTGARVVVRKNGADTKVEQADMNGDKLDGTGPSGFTGDITKQKLYFIDVAWLGSNLVRFGQVISGQDIIMHSYYTANVLATPFTETAILPFRVEIECIATATVADSLKVTCFSYAYDGESYLSSKLRNWDSGLTSITVNTTQKAVFGIRINPSYGESMVKLTEAIITLVSGNSEIRWQLLHNPTLTSPTWANSPNSVAQTLTNATTISYSGGFVAAGGFVAIGDKGNANLERTDIVLGHDMDNNFDVFLLVVETLSSNSKVLVDVDWEEYS